MKKIFILSIFLLSLSFNTAFAEKYEIAVKVNGEEVQFVDAKPFIDENSRTLVPVRFVTEKLGATVDWKNGLVDVVKGQMKLRLAVGEKLVSKEDETTSSVVTLDTVPVFKDGRVFVPLRFIGENFKSKVDWDRATGSVLIYVADNTQSSAVPTPTITPTTIPTPTIQYLDVTPEQIKIPEILEIMRLPNVSYVVGRGVGTEAITDTLEVGFGEINKSNLNHMNSLLNITIKNNPRWVTFNLFRYDSTTLFLLKKILVILYPNDMGFQNTLYDTMVNYRGIPGFKALNLKEGYEFYIDQLAPITDEGVWGKDSFNVWFQIVKK